MKVICFYWQGDRWQQNNYVVPEGHVNLQPYQMARAGKVEDYLPSKYVNNLYYGVKANTDLKFDFICFTNEKLDLDENIEVRPFTMPLMDGVLPRLYMFSKESGLFGHQVLCLDIDIVIVGSLNRLMGYQGTFCSRSDFGRDRRPDGDIMSFKACEHTEDIFWKPFINNVPAAMALTKGRERFWIYDVVSKYPEANNLWDDYAPNQVVSLKIHMHKRGNIPNGARIVSCHGYPRPHQITDSWIKPYWK
jgi:hypothetical protein